MTKEQALAIAADALREVGLERQAWLIEDEFRLPLLELLAHDEALWDRDYEERYCASCSSSDYAAHFDDCFILHAWKYLGDARYQAHVDRVAQEAADEARRKAERDEQARLLALHGRCGFKNSRGTQCTHHGQHTGDHRCPVGIAAVEEANDMLKALYPPERIENVVYDRNPLMNMFGVDRSADPVRLTGVVVETPVGHFDAAGQWFPVPKVLDPSDPASKLIRHPMQVPSVIVSPFIKEGDAYLFNNTLAVSPGDARASGLDETPSQVLKRAAEALKKLRGDT